MKQFFLLLLSLVPFLGQTQNAFPSYDDVALRFFMKNPKAFAMMDQGLSIRLVKSPEGWSAVRENFDKGKNDFVEVDRTIIWTSNNQQWAKDYAALPEPIIRNVEEDTYYWGLDNERSFYLENYYYGYPLWFNDVIKALANKPNLTAIEYYQLGRAYSTAAIQLNFDLSYQENYRNYDTEFDQSFDVSVFPKAYKNKVKEFANKAIASFEAAKKLNPELQTIVGSIGLKLEHERLTWYQEFAMMGLQDIAQEYLNPANYDPMVLAYAQDILNSCPQNSVLLTNGDTDTYPLIYLQAQKGLRPDVVLVNKSLASLPRYMHYVLQHTAHNTLQVRLEPKFYSERGLNYLLPNTKIDNLDAEAFFKELASNPVGKKGNDFLTLPAKAMSLSLGEEYEASQFHNCQNASIVFNLSNVYYPLSTLFVLDLYYSNYQSHRICVTPGGWEAGIVPGENWMNLGLVKMLVPCTSAKSLIIANELINTYSFQAGKVNSKSSSESFTCLSAYLTTWYEIQSVAYQAEDKELSGKMASGYLQSIPFETIVKGNFTQLALLMAYMDKENTKGFVSKLCRVYSTHLQEELESWKTSIAKKEKPAMEFRTQIQSRLNTLAWIKTFYPEYYDLFKPDMDKLYSQI